MGDALLGNCHGRFWSLLELARLCAEFF